MLKTSFLNVNELKITSKTICLYLSSLTDHAFRYNFPMVLIQDKTMLSQHAPYLCFFLFPVHCRFLVLVTSLVLLPVVAVSMSLW